MNKFAQNVGLALVWLCVTDVLDRALGSLVSGGSDIGDRYCKPYQVVANL